MDGHLHIIMTIHLHQILNRVEGWVLRLVCLSLNARLHKVSSHFMLRAQLFAKICDAEIICPHLTVGSLDRLVLVRTLKLDAEAVDDAWSRSWDLFVLGHAADPFSAITETADALHFERTGPGGWDEIPD